MKAYDIEFTVRVNARRAGTDDDDALSDLIAELELVPGVESVELMDIRDCYDVTEEGSANA